MNTRTMRSKALLAFVLGMTASWSQAQFYTIADGSVSACTGALLDSGGQGAGGYSNNENHTLVICPDGTGPAISLQWITFNLSTAGTAPYDQLSIYDGPSVTDPLIGTWSGNDSPGIISASFANVNGTGGGCLTLVFTSNATGTGVFAAAISCFQPCEPPTAAATFGSAVPLLVCQNEVVSFDASASTAVTGFNVDRYIWDFADGSIDSTSGAIVQHSFPDPAEYVVQVTVIDDNNCASTNLVDLQILVSTTPLFTGTTGDTTICQGQSVHLTTSPTAVTWSALPESNLGGGIFLPDDQGVPFSTSITFTNFAPGQTLTDINDLLSVCVDMEHSFMGDLVISIACPTGQSVVFHQQGGGGTFLGIPVDNDATPDIQGECWNYCWSPTATAGTWVANAGGTLPSGTYSSLNPMNALEGCELNGTWTFTVVDLWGSDNGFLCNWTLEFDPSLFPSLTVYTPVLGHTADSASWSGQDLVQDPANPYNATVLGTTPGVFDYTFTVTDNFGCAYDTTIHVTVNPAPQGPINVTGDATYCPDQIANIQINPGFEYYIWNTGVTGQAIQVQAGTYFATVGIGLCTALSDTITVVELPTPVPVITGPQFSCGGQPVVLATEDPYPSYSWSNGAQDPTTTVGSGEYTVTVTSAEGCVGSSAPYVVQISNDPVAAFTTDPLSPQPFGTVVDFIDASTIQDGTIVTWDWTFDQNGGSSSLPSPTWEYTWPGDYVVTLVVTTADGCTHTVRSTYVIIPPEIVIPNVISPNGDLSNDYLVIRNIEYWNNELTIFSRWGNKVYDTKNYRNQWKAEDLPDGTYYYVLKLNDKKQYNGHLTVLR